MPQRRLLDELAQLDTPLVDAAAAVALRDADAATQQLLVAALLARRRPESFAAVIGLYDQLPAEIQNRLTPDDPITLEAVNHVVRGGDSRGRVNGLRILADSRCVRLAYLASDALSDRSTQVRQAAAESLMLLVNSHFQQQESQRLALAAALQPAAQADHSHTALDQLAEQRRALTEALRTAVERHPVHHQIVALEAAMYFVDELRATLFVAHPGRRGPLTHAFLEVLERSHDPRLAGFALAGLEQPELRSGILKILAARRDGAFFEALFHQRWRLASRGMRRALSGLHTLAWLEHGVAALMALPDDVHAAGVSFLAATGMPESTLLELLAGLLDFDSRAAVRQAAWVLVRRRSAEATALLESFAGCDCAEARRMAEFELALRRRRLGADAGAGMEADAAWAAGLRQAGVTEDFEGIWAAADRLDPALCARCGEAVLRRLPNFAASLRIKLLIDSARDRLHALGLVSRLRLERVFASELFDLADHGDDVVRAQSIALLGRVADATSRRIVERALEDGHARVRTAAVDALSAIGGERCQALLSPYMADDDDAVRAAAIRALLMLRIPEAATALIRTLSDERVNHRMAALSLAARLNLRALAGPIGKLAAADGDVGVRKRAQRILRGWNLPAAPRPSASPDATAKSAAAKPATPGAGARRGGAAAGGRIATPREPDVARTAAAHASEGGT